jgi:hypothetical protein
MKSLKDFIEKALKVNYKHSKVELKKETNSDGKDVEVISIWMGEEFVQNSNIEVYMNPEKDTDRIPFEIDFDHAQWQGSYIIRGILMSYLVTLEA